MKEMNEVFRQTLKQGTTNQVISKDFLLCNVAAVPIWADCPPPPPGSDAGVSYRDCVLAQLTNCRPASLAWCPRPHWLWTQAQASQKAWPFLGQKGSLRQVDRKRQIQDHNWWNNLSRQHYLLKNTGILLAHVALKTALKWALSEGLAII